MMPRSIAIGVMSGLLACRSDAPSGEATATDPSTGMPSASSDPSDPASTSTATTAVLDDSTGEPPARIVLDAALSLETIAAIQVVLTTTGDEVHATVIPSRGWGLFVDGATLSGPARIDAFEEAGATFYTARFSAPPMPEGQCAQQPVSIALSLHHDLDAAFVAGALTGYCGADQWFGIPPIEPLRISGNLP